MLSKAGLDRLGLSQRISEVLSPEVCMPAVGQGAIAVECRLEGYGGGGHCGAFGRCGNAHGDYRGACTSGRAARRMPGTAWGVGAHRTRRVGAGGVCLFRGRCAIREATRDCAAGSSGTAWGAHGAAADRSWCAVHPGGSEPAAWLNWRDRRWKASGSSSRALRRRVKRSPKQLSALGAIPLILPLVAFAEPEDFAALDEAIARLEQFDWMIFTSAQAVRAIAARSESLKIPLRRAGNRTMIAAVGPASAEACEAGRTACRICSECSQRCRARERIGRAVARPNGAAAAE